MLTLLRIFEPTWIEDIRLLVFDAYQSLHPRHLPSNRVLIVDIDEDSLRRLGQWPWPRETLAGLTARLDAFGASVIGFNMVFPEEERPSRRTSADRQGDEGAPNALRPGWLFDGDRIFADALSRTPSVLGLSVESGPPVGDRPPLNVRFAFAGGGTPQGSLSYPALLRNLPLLEDAAAGQGLLLVAPEVDGVVRRIPLVASVRGNLYPSFVLELLRVSHQSENYVLETSPAGRMVAVAIGSETYRSDQDGTMWLRYAPMSTRRYLPAWSVLEQELIEPGILDGRTVLIGSTAAGISHFMATPTHTSVPDVEILAQAFETLRDNVYLVRPLWAPYAEFFAFVFASSILIAVLFNASGRSKLFFAGCVILLSVMLSYSVFLSAGLLLDFTFLLTATCFIAVHGIYYSYRYSDILRQKHREYDAVMRQVSENLFDAVIITDESGDPLAANQSALRLLGVDSQENAGILPLSTLVNVNLGDYQRPLSADIMPELVRYNGYREATIEFCNTTTAVVEIAVTQLSLRQNSAYIVVLHDITMRKEAEREVARLGRTLKDAVESIEEGFALWDAENKLVLYNTRFSSLDPSIIQVIKPGLSYAELVEVLRRSSADWPAGDTDRQDRPPRPGIGPFGTGEFSVRSGQWFLATHSQTHEGGSVSVYTDITELKRREIDLIEAAQRIERQAEDLGRFAEDLEQARKKADNARRRAEEANLAKSEFLAMMSHELRTPLNAINGFSETILTEIFGPIRNDRYRDYIKLILESGKKLLSIISTILDISKIESGRWNDQRSHVDIADAINKSIDLLQHNIKSNDLKVFFHCADELPKLWADPSLIDRIIGNILSNAVKFTPAGGGIHISAQPDGPDLIRLIMKDTGIGIPPEHIETALAPFGQIESALSRRFEGTGLGLPLAKLSAEKLGGTLELRSDVGQGTEVVITLPSGNEPATIEEAP